MFIRKSFYPIGLVSLIIITGLCAFSMADKDSFELAKQEIMLRKIGHELLLQAGDSTSRVLPVKMLGENQYQITFENEFTFKPDSLVAVVKRSLAKHNLSENYVVNVLNCAEKEVVYGFAIFKNVKDDIISCTGREQPKSCYFINIKFKDNGISNAQKGYLLGGIPLLAFVGLIISRKVNDRKPKPTLNTIAIGKNLFNPIERNIIINQKIIDLTIKESKLLLIFSKSPNMIIERTRLQKEIWEDEGVIVGRSLDVFVSRLRKKLESDTNLQLINIHNKGYKLEVH